MSRNQNFPSEIEARLHKLNTNDTYFFEECNRQYMNVTIITKDTDYYNGSIATCNKKKTYMEDDETPLNSFYFYETEQFTVLWILLIMIVMGNCAVLLTLSMNKTRKSRMNFFIKQLAIADLLVGLINVLTDIIWRITVAWYAGNVACKVIRYFQGVVTFASTYVLVALSVDRYDAITHPMNFSGSWHRAKVSIIAAWLLSLFFSLPMLFLFEEKSVQGQLQCWIELSPIQWRIYMTLVAVMLFVVPAIIITGCYTVIVHTIWTNSNVLLVRPSQEKRYNSHQHLEMERNENDESHESRRASSRGIIPKAKIKTIKMTFVIVFVFVMCWSPYIIFDLLQVYDFIPRTQTNIAIATFIQSLAPLNSATNPIIYCLFSTRTCKSIKNCLPLKWLCCNMEWVCKSGYRRAETKSPQHGYTRTVTSPLTTPNSSTRRSASSSLRYKIRQNQITLKQVSPNCAVSAV